MTEGLCPACAAEGELRPIVAFGWCDKHYRRWRKHGDPMIVLPRGGIRPDSGMRLETYIDRSGGPDACHPWLVGLDETIDETRDRVL